MAESLIEINAKIHDVENQISSLIQERDMLRRQRNYIYDERLRKLIGMCFKDKEGTCVMRIINTLIEKYRMYNGTTYNEYQLPVLKINSSGFGDVGPLEMDTIFSKAAHFEDPVAQIRTEYGEIPLEEFKQELHNALYKLEHMADVDNDTDLLTEVW